MYRDPADVGNSDYHRSSPTHVRLDSPKSGYACGPDGQLVANGKSYTLFDTGREVSVYAGDLKIKQLSGCPGMQVRSRT